MDDRPIVVAVDDSPSAELAARWAADLAMTLGAPLRLVHVAGTGDVGTRSADDIPRRLLTLIRRTGLRVVSETPRGDVSDLLARAGGQARLLVLGSYGDGASCGALAGDVATEMIAAGSAPLVVVRGSSPGKQPARQGPVVVGVDGTSAGARALRFAAQLADTVGHELVVVHAVADVRAAPDGHWQRLGLTPGDLAEHGARTVERCVREVAADYPGLGISTRVVAATALEALVASAQGAWLVVVGRRRGKTTGLTATSTSVGLVSFAPCPVAVVPSGEVKIPQRVADVMSSPVLSTTPRTRAVDAALTLALHDVSALPVLEDGVVVGMFTENALLSAPTPAVRAEVRVASVMTPCPLIASPGMLLADLAKALRRHAPASVPVLRDGELVGIVTETDLARA